MVNADGDPARHLRHGETILATGDVIRIDRFSFTRPGQAFVGFEWGSQVLLAVSHRIGGTTGMVVFTTLLISATLGLLARWLLRRGCDPLLVAATTLLVAILSNIHWLARPHVISWLPTLAVLFALEAKRPPPLWAVLLLFTVWVNLHGGFLYGMILMGMYLVGHLLEAWSRPELRTAELQRARWIGAALLTATAATFINPYGWHLPWHVVEYFRDPVIRNITHEFLSPDFHALDLYPFLLTLLGTLVLLARGPRIAWTHLVPLAGNVAMALMAQRNVVLFALTGVPVLATYLGTDWDRWIGRRSVARRFAVPARSGVAWPYVGGAAAMLVLVALSHGRVAGRQVIPDGFDPARMPVAAVAQARAAGLEGRIFHEFVWGGYLLWAWPEQKVFIDGGTDFYGGALMRSHRAAINLQPGWRDSLSTWRIDLVLASARGAMAAELGRDPTWRVFYQDSTAVVLQRAAGLR
jgi:hypothetical protein